jgi:hypothetical protein
MAAVGKITEDQRVLMVKLYASGKTTVQIGERLQVSPTRLTVGCIAVVLLFEGLGKPRQGVNFVMMHSMN